MVVSLNAPVIPEGEAIAIATERSRLTDVSVAKAHLKVHAGDIPDFSNEAEVEMFFEDRDRFYNEIGKNRQALVWHVSLRGNWLPPDELVPEGVTVEPEILDIAYDVDANTGEIMGIYY